MSFRTRIEELEKVLAKNDPPETVIRVTVIVVRTREEVAQLRAAGVTDSRSDDGRPVPCGPVRLVVEEAVEAKDWLAARGIPTHDDGG